MTACKIAHIVTRLNIGGPASHTILLTRDLPSLGYRAILIAGECEEGEGDMSYLLNPTDPVYRVPAFSRSVSPFRNLLALVRLWRILRHERPSIVHTHTAMAGCLGRAVAILARVPVVVHTFHGNSLKHYFSPAVSRLFLGIERLFACRTDAICVVAPQQLNELWGELRIAPRSRFWLMPYGLDLASLQRLPLPRPTEPIRVGWFGRLVDVKNIQLLLETAAAMGESRHRFEFHVAGDGDDSRLIHAFLPRLGRRLVWHGWQRDITALLSRCDIVMQTSKNEGMPIALIQGMAAGRPFLSTAVGGVVNMTRGEGSVLTSGATWYDNAVLADPDPNAFARALEEFANRPERIIEMGRSARDYAIVNHSKEVLIAALDSMYRELLQRKLPHD